MAVETLPEPSSLPIATPFRPGLGFLTATPIIAVATVCLALGIDPKTQNISNIGRPIRIADPAAIPIKEALA